MNLSMRDWIWIMGIVAGIATTYGMMSSRVTALESKIKDKYFQIANYVKKINPNKVKQK